MSDRKDIEEAQIKEAMVGVKAGVKTFQQLSSSGRAAQRKREENHANKAFSALDDAFERYLGGETQNEPHNKG